VRLHEAAAVPILKTFGVLRSKNAAKRPQPRRRGGVGQEISILLTNTTPSAPSKVAAPVFF
jgi:hypothetical protein